MPRRSFLHAACLLATASIVACGGGDAGTAPSEPRPSSVVKVAGDGQTGEVGTALSTNPTVEVRDGDGNPMANETVEFEVSSGGGSVSTSSTTTDVEGRASTTWTLGTNSSQTQRLQVSAGSASTSFTAQARPGPPTEILAVGGDGQASDPGATLPEPLVARVVDRYGNGVSGVTVTFSGTGGSVSPAEAVTDSNGEARTTAAVASLGELGSEASIIPASLPRPRLTLDYDQQLEAARTASFSAAAPAVGSVSFEAQVRSGSETTWTLVGGSLPPGLSLSSVGRISGVPSATDPYEFTVEAQDAGGSGVSRTYSGTVCDAPLQLGTGETRSLAPRPSGDCGLFLPSGDPGDRYRVAVVWPSSAARGDDAEITFQIRGQGVAEATAPPLAAVPPADRPSLQVPYERFRWDLEKMRATERVHRSLRNAGRGLASRLGPDAALPDRRPAARASGLAQAPQVRDFNVPATSCSTEEGTFRAERILETPEVVFYQDSVQRADTPVDSALVRRMADFYRDHGQPVIESYFGGISDIDGNGKFIVVVAPFEDTPGQDALAFVLERDFHDQAECPGSNVGEITYFEAGAILAMESGADPHSFQALGALVHEVKHIASIQKRLEAGDLESRPVWIEEGTADIAAEVASRLAWSATGGPNPGSRVTGLSFQERDPPITAENWGILVRLARITNTFASQPNALTSDPVAGSPTHSFYGSSWHFHRFLGDAYGGGMLQDSSFFRKQNAASSDPGIAFLESELGLTFQEMVEGHTVAAMVNGQSAGNQMERKITSYTFPTAAEIFCAPNPLGVYPWTLTTTGTQAQGECNDGSDPEVEEQSPSAPFTDGVWEGGVGRAGWRIHDFVSNGTGQGAEINVDVEAHAAGEIRVVVLRLD